MAPPPRRGSAKASTVVLTGIAGVLCGILVFLVVVNIMGSGGDGRDSPATTFDLGPADARAESVARDGPLLFQDPLNRSRDIYVHHLGEDDWRAFEAHAPGAARACTLRWEEGARRFVDPCDGRSYPADGTGLVSFQARVDDRGHLVVDLRTPLTATASTTTGGTGATG